MVEGFMFSNSVSIWDARKNERVKIGVGMCKDLSIVLIYGPCGVDSCIMVLIGIVHEDCEQWKLFYIVPTARYCGSTIVMEVFWPCKDLSMNDEVVDTMLE